VHADSGGRAGFSVGTGNKRVCASTQATAILAGEEVLSSVCSRNAALSLNQF